MYQAYLNGDKKAFDNLCNSKIEIDSKSGDTNLSTEITDKGLQKQIKKAFKTYKTPCIFTGEDTNYWKKDVADIYSGTYDDVQEIFVETIFKQIVTYPLIESEIKLYEQIKYDVTAIMNNLLRNQVSGVSDIHYSEVLHRNINLTDQQAIQSHNENNEYLKIEGNDGKLRPKHKSYTGFMKTAYDLVKYTDLKQMLPANAIVARDLIDILKEDGILQELKNGKEKLIQQKRLSKLIQERYGYYVSEPHISEALNDIYKLIMEAVIGCAFESRAKFCRINDPDKPQDNQVNDDTDDEDKDKDEKDNKNKENESVKTETKIYKAAPEETAEWMKLRKKALERARIEARYSQIYPASDTEDDGIY